MNPGGFKKPAGIKEIADALGISIGTVDRAIHARKGVSPKTRDRVLKMAQKLNYSPNVAARNLKLNRRLRIGVFLPQEISFFFDSLRSGIRAAARSQANIAVELSFFSYPKLGEGEVEAMKKANWRSFDGIILAPGDIAGLSAITRSATDLEKPIIFVATDAPRLHPLASIAVDATVSGGIAADLFGRFINTSGSVAIFTGDLKIQDHSEKLRGFAASLAVMAPHLTLLPTIESHESAKDAYDSAISLLKSHPDLGAIYINTANSLPVLRAIKKIHHPGKIQVIATDLFPELVTLIENGHVAASLYQRPFTQGKLAFEMLCQFLATGEVPERIIRLAPHIVIRSNLSLFADSLEREELISPQV